MGLFLLISAYFVPGSYDRKGPSLFLKDRIIRLGIPLALYSWIIRPLLAYLDPVRFPVSRPPFLSFITGTYFKNEAVFGAGPLWFIEVLLIFSVFYILWRLFTPVHPEKSVEETHFPGNGSIIVFALLLGAVAFLIRLWLHVGWDFVPLNLQFPFFTQYIALFIIGLIAYRRNWLLGIPDSTGRHWLVVAAVLILLFWPLALVGGAAKGGLDLFRGGLHWQALAYALWESFLGISLCIGLIYAFRRYANCQGKTASLLSHSAYAAYLIHEVVIITIAYAAMDVLRFTAKEIGTWGNELAVEIDPITGAPGETFHIRVTRLAADGSVKAVEEFLNCSMDIDGSCFPPNVVTQDSKLVDCSHAFASDSAYKTAASAGGYSESRRPFANSQAGRDELAGLLAAANNTNRFGISVDGGAYYEVKLDDAFATGSSEVQVTAAIKTRINYALPPSLVDTVVPTFEQITTVAPHFKVLRLTSATADKKSINVLPGASKDVSVILMLGTDQGGLERSRYAPLRPAPSGIFLPPDKLNELANFTQDQFNSLTLDGTAVSLGTSLQTTAATDKWYQGYVSPVEKNSDGVREKLAILAKAINDAGFGWDARTAGYQFVMQKRSAPSFFVSAYSTTPNAITSFSANTRRYALGVGIGSYQSTPKEGVEGAAPDAASFTGSESAHTGFYALDPVDLFNLMVIPRDATLSEDNYRSLWGPASNYCNARRAFLLIDPPDSWKTYSAVTDPTKGIRKLRTGVNKDHGAVFFPKLRLRENGGLKTCGPSGAIAGLIARTDANRGVWKAPAGTEASLVGIDGLDVMLTDRENGMLNKEGVNCLRSFPGGTVNWGGRTMDGADDFASEWKYIPIRCLALYI